MIAILIKFLQQDEEGEKKCIELVRAKGKNYRLFKFFFFFVFQKVNKRSVSLRDTKSIASTVIIKTKKIVTSFLKQHARLLSKKVSC